MYRESETQTIPYAPDYFVKEGTDPEVLLLKDLKYSNGLPAGRREIEMIEQARLKRELESNVLPFTDEACLMVRTRMMEAQELREYQLRENEVEAQKQLRLDTLKRALIEKNETAEFLASQRVEAIRQTRMDVREATLQKIRKKRIKVLRKLASQRNMEDPMLSNSNNRDIINDYFDHGSKVYAPLRREGHCAIAKTNVVNVESRTAPLHLASNVTALEETIPSRLISYVNPHQILATSNTNSNPLFSKTAPLIMNGGGRAAKPRISSAAQRSLRNTRKDVETMQEILTRNKLARTGQLQTASTEGQHLNKTGNTATDDAPGTAHTPGTSLLNRKPKGRPRTPNVTVADKPERDAHAMYVAMTLLQRLIRGRAVQNSMFEGRYRRAELIAELRAADEYSHNLTTSLPMQNRANLRRQEERLNMIKDSTLESVVGSVTSNVLVLLAEEKKRQEIIANMQVRSTSTTNTYCSQMYVIICCWV
jgi:hypothetical protein